MSDALVTKYAEMVENGTISERITRNMEATAQAVSIKNSANKEHSDKINP